MAPVSLPRRTIALLVAAVALCIPALAAEGLGGVAAAGLVALHPQDGPDVDLRIHITDQAVTASVTFNLAFADAVAYVPREIPDVLHPVEAPLLRDALFEFIREKNTVIIDGVPVAPVLREFETPEPESSLLPLFPRTGMRGLIKAHFIVDYPAKSPPQQVGFRWGEFPIDPVLSEGAAEGEELPVIIAGQFQTRGASWIVEFTRDHPEYIWHRADTPDQRFEEVPPPPQWVTMRAVPVASVAIGLAGLAAAVGCLALAPKGRRAAFAGTAALVGLIGAFALRDVGVIEMGHPLADKMTITEQQAIAAFGPLHTNIYRAFDYNEEGDIYDALARSVDGKLLDELYNQIYRGLVMQLEDGAAVSRVQNVQPVETKLLGVETDYGAASFRLSHRWRVTGAVYHWGHSHTRTNEYLAEYTVAATEQADGSRGWRITQSRPLEQFRVDSAPGDAGAFQIPGEL
jgi:hypothetical protein